MWPLRRRTASHKSRSAGWSLGPMGLRLYVVEAAGREHSHLPAARGPVAPRGLCFFFVEGWADVIRERAVRAVQCSEPLRTLDERHEQHC